METVLILEIESTLRIFYKEELEDEGYQILSADNEKEALEMMRGEIPDLIITDYHLLQTKSFMSLADTAHKVKDIPIIIHIDYSGQPMDFTISKNIEYLIKSSNLDNLKSKMRRMLGYKSLTKIS